jgi:hypothetical protein
MRELTKVSMMCSTGTGMVRDEHLMNFLIGLRREENLLFLELLPPLLDSFELDDPKDTKKPLRHSMAEEVPGNSGIWRNSDEHLRLLGEDKES